MAVTKDDIIFQWEGTDKRGVRLKGEKTGRDQNYIRAELRRQGITPQRVRRKPKSFKLGERVKSKDISIFSRQISTMLNAGVPLVQALDIISTASENAKFQKLITNVRTEVESGSNFADTLRKHPVHFDELYCNLVEAGEEAGVLDTVLETIATYKERIEEIKGKVNKAMYYPTAVVAVAIGVSALLLIKVIPQFESIFEGFGAELPAFTQLVVSISDSLVDYGYMYFLVIVGGIIAVVMAKKRSPRFQHFMDRMSLKIPVVGGILRKAALARFARTLGITFAAGVPLVEALRTVSGATGNEVYREAVLRVREDVTAGHQLQLAMQQTNVFPSMVVQMTAIGEEAGSLDQMLKKVAEFYEEEVNNAVDALSSLLEPVIILIVGGLIGSMVIAMYLPIFKMAAVV
ncbi:MAG: type II secretion system F family protein [Gammaproteobacteria bacterium]|jgi:type IV pilus assembly protein PilC|nr:type II secretion system F family protein [Gammaproteobacteria bacterium]